jgi:hypothetical protein
MKIYDISKHEFENERIDKINDETAKKERDSR